MAKQEYERPNCWIRGEMDEKDYQDDPVRLATIRCPHRKGQIRTSIFGDNMDYDCHHPAVDSKEEVEGPRTIRGNGFVGVSVGGGVDSFKTFCEPVDMHLTSLGKESQLIIDVKFREDDEENKNIEEKTSNDKALLPKEDNKPVEIPKVQEEKELAKTPSKSKNTTLEDNTPETADVLTKAQMGDPEALMQMINSDKDIFIVEDVQGLLKQFKEQKKKKK